MKKKLTKNLGMKILSLILATLLWIVIVNIDDPVTTRPFRDIVVEIQHEEAIKSLDKVYEVLEGNTVDVTVKAKRSVLDTIRVSDIKAVADLSNLSYTNAVPITVTCSKPVEQLTLGKVSTLKVALEDIDTKQFKITIVPKGTEEEGYLIGTIKAKPNIIQVSGAKSQIARIDQIRVDIDVSNASEDFTAKGEPKAYDADGRSIDSSKLTFSNKNIQLSASVLKTKTINLDIKSKGTALSGYRLVDIEYEPKEITIAGASGLLKNINSIPIEVDIENAFVNIEEEIDLTQYIPEGTILAEDSKSIMIKVTIEKLQEKNISFNTNDIEIKNLPPGATFNFNDDQDLVIKVTGLAKDLKNVTINSLNPYIDLNGLDFDIHEVELHVETLDGIQLLEVPTLSISLKSANEMTLENVEVNEEINNDD
ncbi:YbbR domain-containing protein [Mobilisporobacter senegalensis]|uniref:YbbR domain-containing protein n=1 Tax=Mobilisporobacter senegalensis TaxID=1329262 RepID=A0A3N1XPT0_9FIRM|nr:CdaR family protein [Mobilisporobacter senegalensis]ROR28626.1 YbbR domain-containing protein [Mobilisporobacter senegalensis]